MKNLLLLSLFVICSCSDIDYFQADENVEYGRSGFVVKDNIIHFKNQDVFDDFVEKSALKNAEELTNWNRKIDFRSLNDYYEESVLKDEEYLQTITQKYKESDVLSIEEIGYSEYTKKLIERGALLLNDEGVLEMNSITPLYSFLVNDMGIVKIGGKFVQFRKNSIRTIIDGDLEKISTLDGIVETTENVLVSNVIRNTYVTESPMMRTEALTSCSDVNDRYKLIVYEEFVTFGAGGDPCANQFTNYYLTLRSLKKTLGQWFNHRTGYLGATTTFTAYHRNCDGSFNTHVASQQGTVWTCATDIHTCTINMINQYNTGPCTNTSPNCYGQIGFITFTRRQHTGRGKNSTTCDVGS